MKYRIAELELKVQALYSVMVEQGIDPKLFDDKIEEILKNRPATPTNEPKHTTCPACGKAVKQSGNSVIGKCMFCGADVPFHPSFE